MLEMVKEDRWDLSPQRFGVSVSTNPFGVGHAHFVFDEGKTLAEILIKTCPDLLRYRPHVFINDHIVKPEYYHVVRPREGSIVSIRMAPMGGGGGGKSPLKTILSIAVIAAGSWAASAFATSAALGLFGGGVATSSQIAFTSALIKGTVGIAGNLLVNTLAPPAVPKVAQSISSPRRESSQTYFIQGATNRLRPYDPLPSLLGTHRIVPPLAVQNYIEVSGDIVYARQMFALSCGKITVSEEKIGNTLLSNYSNIEEEDFFNADLDSGSDIIPAIVTQNNLNISAPDDTSWSITQTTGDEIDELEVQITFPSGLNKLRSDTDDITWDGSYSIRYSPAGAGTWTTNSHTLVKGTTSAFTVSQRVSGLTRGKYDVQFKRNSVKDDRLNIQDSMNWTALVSIQSESPVVEEGVSGKAVRIQGTDQLNGAIEQYNALASRLIPDFISGAWVADQVTTNPASVFLHLLKATEAQSQIDDAEIDYDAIEEWHDFCASKGLSYSAYIDSAAERETLIKEVASSGLAAPVIIDNKYSVVVDKPKTNYIQHISPRNSYNYGYEKVFKRIPHAFRCALLNKDEDYLQDEIIVCDDGYDSTTATDIIQWDFPGVVDVSAVYKLARHRLAEMRLRPDMHQVTMDIENLVATKGDKVKFSHDVCFIGLGSGRVKTVNTSGSDIVSIVGDETFNMTSGSYSAEFRLADGTSLTVGIVLSVGDTSTLTFTTPVPIASGPAVGDLFSFGQTDSVTIDALIHSVEMQSDFGAVVNLVRYGAGVFTASDGAIPAFDNTITLPQEFERPVAPVLVSIQSDEFVQVQNIDGSISSRLVIVMSNQNLLPVAPIVKIRQVGESTYSEADVVVSSPNRVIIENCLQGAVYDLLIYYRRTGGSVLGVPQISAPLEINGHTFIGTSLPPPDVEGFNIVVRGETVYLEWQRADVIDLSHYEVRFSSETTLATWGNSLPYADYIPKETTQIAVASAVGSYLIRAIDKTGNKSENAAVVPTTIGALLGLNVVETIEEHLTWGGTFDDTVTSSGALRLDGTLTGYYYFENTYDLGEIYDNVVSVSFAISGTNDNDLIDDWGYIDDRGDWDGAAADQYEVRLQIRTTNDDTGASPVTWSEWQNFVVGEYTARGFQFRLLLTSFVDGVTPLVEECTVVIDMPDRDERGYVSSSGTGGYTVTFAEPFKVAPQVVVSCPTLGVADNIVGPDNITTSGFDIEFFVSAVSADKPFFWHAKGYGRAS